MTDSPADAEVPDQRKSTPVPPRGGKGRAGGPNRPPGRPGPANRNNPKGRQARQAAQRRNRHYAIAAVVVVVAIVALVVGIGVSSSGSSGPPRQPISAADQTQLENIPVATLVAATTKGISLQYATTAAGGTLTSAGKPELLFVGAEFCPICAAQRWPMTIALMKFGTFTNLQTTHSAKADGNAGTLSYYGSTYSSPYLTFNANELYTNQPSGSYYKTLDKLTPAETAVWTANQPSSQTFPFIDFAGKATLQTAQYNPETIYNMSFSDILSSVGSNDNTVGASIDASSAVFIKYLCGMTNDQPQNVCAAVANVNAPIQPSNSGTTTPASG